MPDLKAAAEIMRVALKEARSGQVILAVKNDLDMATQMDSVCDSLLLAAQALEAMAWMKESRFVLDLDTTGSQVWWNCYLPFSGQYYQADTPLGAILAAMEEAK